MAQLLSAKRLPLKKEYRDPFSLINRLFVGWVCRDRFGVLNPFSPYNLYNDVSEEDKLVLDYKNADRHNIKDLIDKRAQSIMESNERVTVAWSGGVDSTAIVSAFLKNGIDPKNLTVLGTSSSEEEYPWFYRYLHEVGVNYIETENIVAQFDNVDEGVIVMGWCADQLFGSNIHIRNLDWYHLPWMEGLSHSFEDRRIKVDTKEFKQIQEVFTEYSKLFGVNMMQFCEFAFLFNFGVKWTYVSQESNLSVSKQNIRDRIHNFFEPIEFQHWSLQNYNKLRLLNSNRHKKFYKRPLKEYIYYFTEDDYYFKTKGKMNSWVLTSDDYDAIGVLDTDGYHRFALAKGSIEFDQQRLTNAVEKRYLKGVI